MENNTHKQEHATHPFIIEEAEPISVPHVEIEKGKLLINGVEDTRFGFASYLQKQKNGLASFVTQNDATKVATARFIDIENPEKEFPSVVVDDRLKNVLVGGYQWKSFNTTTLAHKRIFNGGYTVSVDPVTEDVVFYTQADRSFGDVNEIIDNDLPWKKNKFQEISLAESINGTVFAIAHKKDTKDRLYVNDNEWHFSEYLEKDANNRDPEEKVIDVEVNGNGAVVAIIVSPRGKTGKALEHVFVGDNVGAKKEWKNAFDYSDYRNRPKTSLDKNSDCFAIVGNIDGVPQLVVNDVVVKLTSIPHSVEMLRVEDGVVFIQYVSATGKTIAEKVTLNEGAHEIQQQNERERDVDEAMRMLRKLLGEGGTTPRELVQTSMKYADLKKKTEQTLEQKEKESNKIYELQNRIDTLLADYKVLKESNIRLEEKNSDLTLENMEMKTVVAEVELLLEKHSPGKGGMFSKGKGMEEKMHEEFKNVFNGKRYAKNGSSQPVENNPNSNQKEEKSNKNAKEKSSWF